MGLSVDDLSRLSPAARKQIMRQLGKPEKSRGNKCGNRECSYMMQDGTEIRFQSERERDRFASLLLLQRCGEISDLKCQVPYLLIPAHKRDDGSTERGCSYIADFVYERDGKTVVEDAKGYRDPSSAVYAKFVIKRKLMLDRYGITVKEVE